MPVAITDIPYTRNCVAITKEIEPVGTITGQLPSARAVVLAD